jgi:YegS/Rv2252/BmrU family lipid kinase
MIIHNPTSGSGDVRPELGRVRAFLVERGWSIDLEQTHAIGDAGRMAGEAADAGLDSVLVAGGDGTLNEAVNALVETNTAVGILPCGTANVWARQLGMPPSPRRLLEAARFMDGASVRAVDVGRVSVCLGTDREVARYFLLWSGIGLDAYVTRMVEPRPASFRRWGVVGYSLAALRAALRYRGAQVDIEIDGRRWSERALLIVVSNAALYAGTIQLSPDARIDDRWLDVSVFPGEGLRASFGHFVRVLLQRHVRDSRVRTLRARRVRVETSTSCDVHADAEPIGTSPAEYSIAPRALRALVPTCAPRDLFASDQENSES